LATEELNQANTGQIITDVKRQVRNPALRWMAATLDGRLEARPATVHTAGSKPPTTAPTKTSKRLCSRLRNNVKLFLSMIFEVRI
jgi:hypothetical protein